jgi:hypothetical protein
LTAVVDEELEGDVLEEQPAASKALAATAAIPPTPILRLFLNIRSP